MRKTAIHAAILALVGASLSAEVGAAAAKRPFFVSFVADTESLILAYEDGSLLSLGVPDLTPQRSFDAEPGRSLNGVSVSADGRRLAADYDGGSLWIWDLGTGDVVRTLVKARPRSPAVFLLHPNRDRLLVFERGELEVWDLSRETEPIVVRPVHLVRRMAISPGGRLLVVEGECEAGGRRADLCVVDLESSLVIASGRLEELSSRSFFGLAELALPSRGEVFLAFPSRLPDAEQRPYFFLSTANLRVLRQGEISSEEAERVGGTRSAPDVKLLDRSSDQRWEIEVNRRMKALYLYRLGASGDEVATRLVRQSALP